MWDRIVYQVDYYANFYWKFVLKQWDRITPTEYAFLLVGIAVAGWFLLRNSVK